MTNHRIVIEVNRGAVTQVRILREILPGWVTWLLGRFRFLRFSCSLFQWTINNASQIQYVRVADYGGIHGIEIEGAHIYFDQLVVSGQDADEASLLPQRQAQVFELRRLLAEKEARVEELEAKLLQQSGIVPKVST